MTTKTRPPEFDARVMAYRPGLFSLAGKLGLKGEERHDLVTDTIIEALERWQNYREDGGFWNWLYWTMRGKHTNARDKRQLPMTDKSIEDVSHLVRAEPSQERYLELSQTLAKLSAGRKGHVLLRRAMGDTLQEISNDIGVNRERVRQIEEEERAVLLKRVKHRRAA